MEAVEAQHKQRSDRKIAEQLLSQWNEHNKTSKEATAEKKALELALHELAEKHEEWFDGKTAEFDNGRLKWVAKSKLNLPSDFDMDKFRKKYPNLVKVKEEIPISKARSYEGDPNYDKFGISIETEDVFAVEGPKT